MKENVSLGIIEFPEEKLQKHFPMLGKF